MTNKDFQKELKEKIKEGIKPSDLKKKKEKIISQIPTPPPSPIITPIDKKVSKKQGQEGNSPSPIVYNKKIQELEKDVEYWSQTAQTHLKNLQLITATLTNTQEENKELKEKIKELSEPKQKITMENKKKEKIKKEAKETLIKSQEGVDRSHGTLDFFCEMCEENKTKQHLNLRKLNSGLGMDLNKLYKMCDNCVNSGRWDIKTERNNEHDLLNW